MDGVTVRLAEPEAERAPPPKRPRILDTSRLTRDVEIQRLDEDERVDAETHSRQFLAERG